MSKNIDRLRDRLLNKEILAGTFVKTPSAITAEVLGFSSLDVFCIDTEHAPFGPLELDASIAAFRAADKPCLVRVRNDSATEIRGALDSGAAGILVPHVTTPEQAATIVKSAHFGEGGRGYAGSTRAARFGHKPMADHLSESRKNTTVVVQIEDLAALDQVTGIASVDGIDAIFVGRADLAVAMGKSIAHPAVLDAVRNICAAAADADITVGMFAPDIEELPDWRAAGVSLFLLSSDQHLMVTGANTLAGQIHKLG